MPNGIHALLLDVEGVLVRGDEPLAGALEASVRLRAAGIPFRLLTNISRLDAAEIAGRLERLGFSIDPEEIWNPPRLAGRLLRRHAAVSPVAVVCSDVRTTELARAAPPTEAALAGADLLILGDTAEEWTPDLAAWLEAAVARGTETWLLAPRPDPPVLGLEPAAAADELFACLQRMGAEPLMIGKPGSGAFQAAAADLSLPDGSVVAMVGDDLEIDVAGALTAGLLPILVLSGRTTIEGLESSGLKSIRHAEDLGAFVHRWLKIR